MYNNRIFFIPFKVIYVPFLIITISMVVGYTTLRWVLGIQQETELFDIFFPCILGIILFLIFMLNRIKILDATWKNRDYLEVFCFFVIGAIILPTIVVQLYISDKVEVLNEKENILELEESKQLNQKYYRIRNFQLDAEKPSFNFTQKVEGTKETNLKYIMYMVVPFKDGNST